MLTFKLFAIVCLAGVSHDQCRADDPRSPQFSRDYGIIGEVNNEMGCSVLAQQTAAKAEIYSNLNPHEYLITGCIPVKKKTISQE